MRNWGLVLRAAPQQIKSVRGAEVEEGKYTFRGIRPGKYRLFALDYSQLPDEDPLQGLPGSLIDHRTLDARRLGGQGRAHHR